MNYRVFLVLLCCGLAGCESPDLARPKVDLLIADVTVVDAVFGTRLHQDVLIVGNQIAAVVPAVPAVNFEAARVIDGSGRFLIPGLWDMHVHFLYDEELTDAMPDLFLDYGITSVRDTGGDVDRLIALRHRLQNGDKPVPDIYVSGPLLDGAHVVYDGGDSGRPPLGIANPTPDDAAARVSELAAKGVDFIKIYELVTPEIFRAMVRAARAKGLPIAAHVPLSMTADTAGPGVDSMEHLRNVELACASNWEALLEERRHRIAQFEGRGYDLRAGLHLDQRMAAIATYDEQRCRHVLASLTETIQVPTLRLNTLGKLRPFEREEWQQGLNRMPALVADRWRAAIAGASGGRDPAFANWSLELVGRMHAADVPIGAGTDTPIGLGIPGESLHAELALLVMSGLSPIDALYAATVRPARFFGLETVRGQVRSGMEADLLLLERNPLEDIDATREIIGVISNGAWVRGDPDL